MSSKDDPFGSDGKTVIRPNADNRKTSAGTQGPSRRVPENATVLFEGGAVPALEDLPSRTVIYDGAAPGVAGPSPLFEGTILATAGGPSVLAQPSVNVAETAGEISFPASNTLLALAAPVLVILSRWQQLAAAGQPAELSAQLAGMIEKFDRDAAETDIRPEDARIAKYALCETADDIVQNLPGYGAETWKEHGMLLKFFKVKNGGVGFFEALNQVLADPEPRQDLIELMHACLSLGFKGQYRGQAGSAGSFERVRQDVYDTLRYYKARTDELSPRWMGLSESLATQKKRVPLWAIAAGSIAVVAGTFIALRAMISNDGDALAAKLLALTPPGAVTIARAAFEPVKEAEPPPVVTTQLDRIRQALAADISAGGLSVDAKGDFIVVEISNQLLFQSGKAEVKDEFIPVAERLATMLEPEKGPVRIVGHTDNVKPRRSSAYKSNFDLSVARAKAVEKAVAPKLADPARIVVEGKGEDEPIADNATPEGRAKNRRVDILIPREETL